jgi:hypothetical protein
MNYRSQIAMKRLSTTCLLAALLGGLLVSAIVRGAEPDLAHSTVPPWIRVTGFTSNHIPDPEGVYCVTIRDFANNAEYGALIELDFSACCDMNVCSDAVPGQTLVSCTPPKFTAYTDRTGVACFSITGAAKDAGTYVEPGPSNGAIGPCVRLKAENFDFGVVASALAYDQNGAVTPGGGSGVNTLDLSVLIALVRANNMTGGARYRARANYSGPSTGDAVIDVLDLSFLLTQIGRANATPASSSKLGCPSGTYCTVKVPGPNCP